mgnify:CR=1 FL=1
MITCPQCQYQNPTGALICEGCGALLLSSQEPPGTTRSLGLDERPPTSEMGIRGTKTFPIDAQLIIDVGDMSERQALRIDEEVIMGRVDHHTDFLPDVNLSRFGAWEKGVSRLHAAIRRRGDALVLVDLGSTNGTFLNDERLAPRQAQQLRDGDRIRLGLCEMVIYYESPRPPDLAEDDMEHD